jgi:hypothetical protein
MRVITDIGCGASQPVRARSLAQPQPQYFEQSGSLPGLTFGKCSPPTCVVHSLPRRHPPLAPRETRQAAWLIRGRVGTYLNPP